MRARLEQLGGLGGPYRYRQNNAFQRYASGAPDAGRVVRSASSFRRFQRGRFYSTGVADGRAHGALDGGAGACGVARGRDGLDVREVTEGHEYSHRLPHMHARPQEGDRGIRDHGAPEKLTYLTPEVGAKYGIEFVLPKP